MTQNDAGPGGTTVVPQGDLRLLESDLARRLLASTVPARVRVRLDRRHATGAADLVPLDR